MQKAITQIRKLEKAQPVGKPFVAVELRECAARYMSLVHASDASLFSRRFLPAICPDHVRVPPQQDVVDKGFQKARRT